MSEDDGEIAYLFDNISGMKGDVAISADTNQGSPLRHHVLLDSLDEWSTLQVVEFVVRQAAGLREASVESDNHVRQTAGFREVLIAKIPDHPSEVILQQIFLLTVGDSCNLNEQGIPMI